MTIDLKIPKPGVGEQIFICGHPKSGTTLLTALLDGHSEIAVFPEETFYVTKVYKHQFNSVEDGVKYLLESRALRNIAKGRENTMLDGNFDYSDVDYEKFEQRFRENLTARPLTHAEVLGALVTAYAQSTAQGNKRYWVEKTPGTEHHLSLLWDWYEKPRALYILRDPRDVYVSYKRKKEIESDGEETLPIEDFICRWGLSLWAWETFAAQTPATMLVRYEDLLTSPKSTLAHICHFLGIEYEDSLTKPTKNGKRWKGNSMYGERFEGINTKPLGRWQQQLSPQQLTVIENYLGKAMVSRGYQTVAELPSLSQLLSCWLRHRRKRKQIAGTLLRLYSPVRLPCRFRN